MIIVTTDDFKNFQALAQSNNSKTVLQYFIDKYEASYINQLLGVQLAGLLITECQNNNGVPTTQRLVDFFNSFDKQDGATVRHSNGLKDMLVCIVFYHYVLNTSTATHTQAGVASNSVDASTMLNAHDASRFAESRFNDMLTSWDNIIWFLRQNAGVYPEFKQGNRPSAKWNAVL